MAYRQADPAAEHPGFRVGRDADRPGGAGDAEALEPGPDRRVERRVRIDRVRTGSIAASSSLSCAPKAISPKSRFSSVAGAPSSAEISSTSSW